MPPEGNPEGLEKTQENDEEEDEFCIYIMARETRDIRAKKGMKEDITPDK